MTDQELRDQFPAIPWDEPLRIIRTDGIIRYVCRYCVVHDGLKAMDLDAWPDDISELNAHLVADHG